MLKPQPPTPLPGRGYGRGFLPYAPCPAPKGCPAKDWPLEEAAKLGLDI